MDVYYYLAKLKKNGSTNTPLETKSILTFVILVVKSLTALLKQFFYI